MRHQHIKRDKPKSQTQVVDERTPRATTLQIDPKYANAPVRAVNFVEVRDMDTRQIQLMIQKLAEVHKTAEGGIHYFIPIRNGKIGSDVLFEEEFLDIVNKICEVNKDGKIVLKGGAKDVLVIRQKV